MTKSKDVIVINKKILLAMAPVAAITAVLVSGNNSPEALLFLVGVFAGIFVGKAIADQKR